MPELSMSMFVCKADLVRASILEQIAEQEQSLRELYSEGAPNEIIVDYVDEVERLRKELNYLDSHREEY